MNKSSSLFILAAEKPSLQKFQLDLMSLTSIPQYLTWENEFAIYVRVKSKNAHPSGIYPTHLIRG